MQPDKADEDWEDDLLDDALPDWALGPTLLLTPLSRDETNCKAQRRSGGVAACKQERRRLVSEVTERGGRV